MPDPLILSVLETAAAEAAAQVTEWETERANGPWTHGCGPECDCDRPSWAADPEAVGVLIEALQIAYEALRTDEGVNTAMRRLTELVDFTSPEEPKTDG